MIGLIGTGAIGSYVRDALAESGAAPEVLLVRAARLDEEPGGPLRVASAADLPEAVDLVVECGGHEALREHGPAILRRGIDLVTVSIGALADAEFAQELEAAAKEGGARLHLASGAIGTLDCLASAKVGGLDMVRYTGRKPPKGWKGSPADDKLDLDGLIEAAVHFEGSARQAAQDYPKNANVAAAVALAGSGMDATEVRLIADPAAPGNVHEVEASGAFGSFSFTIEGRGLESNPRSSALAAMSAVAAVLRLRAPIAI